MIYYLYVDDWLVIFVRLIRKNLSNIVVFLLVVGFFLDGIIVVFGVYIESDFFLIKGRFVERLVYEVEKVFSSDLCFY